MISGDRNQRQRYCSPAADSTTPLAEDFNLRNSTPPSRSFRLHIISRERTKPEGRTMNENIQSTNGSNTHVRHAAPAHSQIANGGGRNSSIELLRIIAMFMILAHHFIVHNGYDVLKLPLGPERIFFQLVMAGGGKVGVVIFFSISAWFFLDKE